MFHVKHNGYEAWRLFVQAMQQKRGIQGTAKLSQVWSDNRSEDQKKADMDAHAWRIFQETNGELGYPPPKGTNDENGPPRISTPNP